MKTTLHHIVLLLSAMAPALLPAADWPHFQGPNGNGTSPETGLNFNWEQQGPAELWSMTLDEGFGGAAIVGEEVFVVDRKLGETDVLLCLNLADGAEKWRFEFNHPGRLPHHGSRGVPWVEEDAVYFTSGFGHVHRINRLTHQADWTLDVAGHYNAEAPRWGWAQSPLIVGDILVVAPMSGMVGLAGLDKKTGKELWTTEGFGNSHSTPALVELGGVPQVTFIATDKEKEAGTTIAVDPATGKVLWQTDVYFNAIPIPFPIRVDDERLFLTGGYDAGSRMIAVKKEGESWEVEKLFELEVGSQMHPPILVGNHLYFLANENSNHKGEDRGKGGLMCMDLLGKVKWNTGAEPFMGRGNMIMADGKLLIQDGETGYLRVVNPDPERYEQIGAADIFNKSEEVEEMIRKQDGNANVRLPDFKFWSPMALSNGRLILRGQTQLKCVDLRGGRDT